MGKKEPIAELEVHNRKRESEVREQTAKLNEYIVERYGLKKISSETVKAEEKKVTNIQNPKLDESNKKDTSIESDKAKQVKKV